MEITIKGTEKEITALVLAVQDWRSGKDRKGIINNEFERRIQELKERLYAADVELHEVAKNDKTLAAKLAEMAERREQRTKKILEEYPWNLRLYIRDKRSGETHLIGSDVHDRLFVNKCGRVIYENMQNGDGTMIGPICGYEFVPTPEEEL